MMELDQVFNIRLIPMSEQNVPAVLEVYRQCEDFLSLGPQSAASKEMVIKDIQTCQTNQGVYYAILLAETEMIGVLAVVPREVDNTVVEAYIELLMITPRHRRKKIGRHVLKVIEANIKNKTGVFLVSTSVQTNNPDAIRFWQNNGYVISEGPERQPDSTTVYHMRKDLGQPEK
jgi:ribosomal protein S18 acetylase RimI-like enzyme